MKQILRLGERYGLFPIKRYIGYVLLIMIGIAWLPNDKAQAQTQRRTISGTVVSVSNGKPLEGATVKLKSGGLGVMTDKDGSFRLPTPIIKGTLIVTFIGYQTQEVDFGPDTKLPLIIKLAGEGNELEEVEVSTGYQQIPKERATGSFTFIDSALLSRSVSPNIMERLDGVASGLIINRNLPGTANNSPVAVRGRSTIFGNPEPLVVLDGFPYEGDVNNINAADVISVTLLKDAAAASIWGTRAGNGVIVIVTNRGKLNQPPSVGVQSTFSTSPKPDLYAKPRISSSDFVELETELFRRGYYSNTLSNGYGVVSQVVELLDRQDKGQLSATQAQDAIREISQYDIRDDLDRYVYRNSQLQQYQLQFSGGGNKHTYYLSAGLDQQAGQQVTDSYRRITIDAKNTTRFFTDRLTVSSGISAVATQTKTLWNKYTPYSPYDRLADDQGNSLAVVSDLRTGYTDTAGAGRLLDWSYRPLNELSPDHNAVTHQYQIRLDVNYQLLASLALNAAYQYQQQDEDAAVIRGLDRYYTRNLINQYSQINGSDVIRPIPLGAIKDYEITNGEAQTLRVQAVFDHRFNWDGQLTGILGFEGNKRNSLLFSGVLYGYDQFTLANSNEAINSLETYPHYYGSQGSLISTGASERSTVQVNQSYYGNGSYTHMGRYILSGSFRRDESNLFGVKSNQRGVPLWSAGVSWLLHKEPFYKLDWLPQLKFRATYGYNGNVDKTISGFLTVRAYGRLNSWNSPYATIENPPNPALRWEKVKTYNVGLDLDFLNRRLSASIDYFSKTGIDLIGNSAIAPQTGVTSFRGNSANTRVRGMDLQLHTENLITRFKWSSDFLLSYNQERITSYLVEATSNGALLANNFNNPLQGYPYYAVFSYPSAGLDTLGMPLGYLNGEISNQYSAISNLKDAKQLRFHGSGTPVWYGNLRNTFQYNGIELSFNISFKLAYFQRRPGFFTGSNYNSFSLLADYDKRWQHNGDEVHTQIPALVYPVNSAMNNFVKYSEYFIERADHIRLQDIRLAYRFGDQLTHSAGVRSASIFVYASQLGILWQRNRLDLDPESWGSDYPAPMNVAVGVNFKI